MSQDFSRPPKIAGARSKRRTAASAAAPEGSTEPSATLPEITTADATRYVSDTLAELARLSRRFGLDTLAYMIEVAHLEAQSTVERQRVEGAAPLKPSRR